MSYSSEGEISRGVSSRLDPLRILIVSTAKTGNTWMKALLATLYDLPVVEIRGIWDGNVYRFDPSEASRLGSRWIAHQHFDPQPELLAWAHDNDVHLITTLRHPGDVLVSLYHYAHNYADTFVVKPPILSFLSPPDETRRVPAMQDMEGGIAAYVRARFFAELDVSLRWLEAGVAHPVRYEDLWLHPVTTIDAVTSRIGPVSRQHIEWAIALCDITLMRQLAGEGGKFYRQGGIGGWRSSLPAAIVDLLQNTDPYPAQFTSLGYSLDPGDPLYTMPRQPRSARNPFHGITHFDNGVPIPPVLVALFLAAEPALSARWYPVERTASPHSFYAWLNAPAPDDPGGANAAPRLTNLAVYLYRIRCDLQAAFPDIFGRDRAAFLTWYCRYPQTEFALGDAFITPIREGLRAWLNPLARIATQSARDRRRSGRRIEAPAVRRWAATTIRRFALPAPHH